MNNVYLTVNQLMMDRFADSKAHSQKTFRSTKGIIHSLENKIGLNKIRIITPNQMYDPQSNHVADVYKFNKGGYLVETGESFETPALVMIDENGFLPDFSMKELERQHEFYRTLQNKGRIGHMINTVDSKETNDKAKLVDLFSKYNPPTQFNYVKPNDLGDLISTYGSSVIKHRFGSDGENFFIATNDNYKGIVNSIGNSLDEFVCQPMLNIKAESRLVFIDGEVVGSRIIEDRRLPGESKKDSSKLHQVCKYDPSIEEVQSTLEAAKIGMMEVGCIDWIYLQDGTRHILELNDVGTAMIATTTDKGEIIFDLCDPLADQIIKYF